MMMNKTTTPTITEPPPLVERTSPARWRSCRGRVRPRRRVRTWRRRCRGRRGRWGTDRRWVVGRQGSVGRRLRRVARRRSGVRSLRVVRHPFHPRTLGSFGGPVMASTLVQEVAVQGAGPGGPVPGAPQPSFTSASCVASPFPGLSRTTLGRRSNQLPGDGASATMAGSDATDVALPSDQREPGSSARHPTPISGRAASVKEWASLMASSETCPGPFLAESPHSDGSGGSHGLSGGTARTLRTMNCSRFSARAGAWGWRLAEAERLRG